MRTTLIFVLAHAVLCGSADAQSIAITNATVYTSPDASAQTHTTILIQGGKVAAVARNVVVPPGVRILACQGCVVFAGFWNSHVHFTGPQWAGADRVPAAQLSRDMRVMLTHSGFTTVVDTASDVSNTVVLRRRVQSAEVAGPRIYTDSLGPFSDLVVALLASIAKLEREKIRERTLAGLARARKQGRIGGRPRADEDAMLVASVQRLRDVGKSIRDIAAALDKSPTTIQRLVKAEAA
jgi:dihydroorotase-like cyclic amidohydrolase